MHPKHEKKAKKKKKKKKHLTSKTSRSLHAMLIMLKVLSEPSNFRLFRPCSAKVHELLEGLEIFAGRETCPKPLEARILAVDLAAGTQVVLAA